MGPAIEVTIDEVVLRGVPPERAREVVAALELALEDHARVAQAAEDAPGLLAGRAESSRRLDEVRCVGTDGLGDAVAGAVWQEIARSQGRRSGARGAQVANRVGGWGTA